MWLRLTVSPWVPGLAALARDTRERHSNIETELDKGTAPARERAATRGLPDNSRQRLAPNIGRALDIDQHADTSVRADMRLLSRQE